MPDGGTVAVSHKLFGLGDRAVGDIKAQINAVAAAILGAPHAPDLRPAVRPRLPMSDAAARDRLRGDMLDTDLPRPRRRMTLRIGSGFLPVLLGEGLHSYSVIKEPLPADTEIVGARMSDDMRNLILLLASESFPETAGGESYPEIFPYMSQV